MSLRDKQNNLTTLARRLRPYMIHQTAQSQPSAWVINEDSTALTDGTVTQFSTAHQFSPGKLLVFVDGSLQRPGSGNDYEEDAGYQSFTFSSAPANGVVLLASYIKAASGGIDPTVYPPVTTYIDLVNSLSPVAFWPLNETSGATAHCEVDADQDGAFANVTLGAKSCPFGEIMAPDFNGSTSLVNVYSTALNTSYKAAVNADEFSMMAWIRIDEVADWIDLTTGTILHLRTDGTTEYVRVRKGGVGGCPTGCPYVTGLLKDGVGNWGTDDVVMDDTIPTTPTDWALLVITWSLGDLDVTMYFNGTTQSLVDGFDVTFTGNLDSTKACIGAEDTSATNPFKGQLCYVAIFDYKLTAANIDALANYTP